MTEHWHWEYVTQIWKSMEPVRIAFLGDSYERALGNALSTLTDERFCSSKDYRILLEVESPQSIRVKCPDLELRPIWVNLVDGWSPKALIISILTTTEQLNIDERTLSLGSRDPFKGCHGLIYSLQWLFTFSIYSRHFTFAMRSGDRFIREEFREGRLVRQERLSTDEVSDTGFEMRVEMEPSFFPDHDFSVDKLKARFANFHWGEMEPLGDLSRVKVVGLP